jgi:pilus assembly protein CpaE
MSNPAMTGRRVSVVGERLAPVAREALPGAVIQSVTTEHLLAPPRGDRAADLMLIDADTAAPEALTAALEAMARRPSPPPTVLVGSHLPTNLVRALLRLERSDVLDAPFAPEALTRIAQRLMSAPAADPAGSSRCWSVVSAAGGAGATTVAIEIAAALAALQKGGRRVCLVDLNLADGAASAFLGATPLMHLAGSSATAERIDAAVLAAFAVETSAGFDLLAGPRNPNAFAEIAPETVCRLLEVACQVYGAVVVDLPRIRQAWTLDVLAGSDEVCVVSELTVPALLAARALVGEVEAELDGGKQARLVVNRLASRVFGPVPSLIEAEKALQRKAVGGITSDWEAAAASVNLGGSISQHRPKSKIVQDVKRLVDRLISEGERGQDIRRGAA